MPFGRGCVARLIVCGFPDDLGAMAWRALSAPSLAPSPIRRAASCMRCICSGVISPLESWRPAGGVGGGVPFGLPWGVRSICGRAPETDVVLPAMSSPQIAPQHVAAQAQLSVNATPNALTLHPLATSAHPASGRKRRKTPLYRSSVFVIGRAFALLRQSEQKVHDASAGFPWGNSRHPRNSQ